MRPARRHHKIPQFYLRGFADVTQPEKIWVYRRRTTEGEIASAPRGPSLELIENVSVERDRFATTTPSGSVDHDSVEDELARQENLANPILRRLRSSEALTRPDKEALASYMSLLYRRGDSQEERQKRAAQKAAEKNVSLERLAWAAMMEGDLTKANDVFTHPYKYRGEIAHNVANIGVTVSLEKVEAFLCEMTWQFLTAPEGEFFITTDSPVYLGEPFGLIHDQAAVLFPISSGLLLFAGKRTEGADLAFGATDSGRAHMFNLFVMRQAYGEIYGREKAAGILGDLQVLADESARLEAGSQKGVSSLGTYDRAPAQPHS